MDLSWGGAVSDDEQENQSSSHKGKRNYNRHSSSQVSKLETIFKERPHPDEHQRRGIAIELGLEPKQVKFWFQNKRTQMKTLSEKAANTALRVENERMLNENIRYREALKNAFCLSCGVPSHRDREEHELCLKQLKLENARLKEEHDKIAKLLACYMDNKKKPAAEPELQLGLGPTTGSSSYDRSMGKSLKLAVERAPFLSLGLGVGSSSPSANSVSDENMLPSPTSKREEIEKAMMLEAGIAAKEELLKLLCTNEPLWVKSQVDRRLILHTETYDNIFPRVDHFKGSKVRVESSKDSRIVRIRATQLVDMLLDSEKWTNLFSTIVTKAHTIKELERGSSETRSGALLLMYEEMHALSPFVPSREFYFLRYCEQVEAGIWVIADVSYDYLKEDGPHSCTWRFPSGCMIHQISRASSQVTWIEHVEVDDKIQTHRLYRDLVNRAMAFGAERWLMELQRMCERFTSAAAEYMPPYDRGGVITKPEGRRSVMKLSHRMVQSFCGALTLSSKMEFPQHLTEEDNSGIRISIRKNTDPRMPNDIIIITVATSFSLPLPSQVLFDFFRDPAKRVQWDLICHGNPVREIAHISNGTHPNNHISIIQPINHPTANGVVILQESFIDPLGSYVVYSPVNIPELMMATNGEDSSTVSVLPSGFVISEDSQSMLKNPPTFSCSSGNGGEKARGSLLTVAFQILMSSSTAAVNLESVASVNSLMTTTVQNIKDALLNGSDLE